MSMKKIFFIVTLFSLLGLMPSLAQTRNVLSIPDFTVANSSDVILPIDMENTSDVVAVQFTMNVPSGINVDASSAQLNPSRKTDHNMTFRSIGNNKYMCIINSIRNEKLRGNEGILLTVPLTKTSSQDNFTCHISLSDVVVAIADGSDVVTDFHSGNIAFRSMANQAVCGGTESAGVDFYELSSLFDYSWSLKTIPGFIEGYMENGRTTIPAMILTNEGTETETLKYNVDVTYGGTAIYSFEYGIAVRPLLLGAFFNFTPHNNAVVASNSINLSWNNIINAVYDVYLWKESEDRPTAPIASNLTVTELNANRYCGLGETYMWYVVAHNECHELVSETHKFTVRDLPDLHVTRVDCSDPVAGENMTVEWTVKNDGVGSTEDATWNDYIWLVPDMQLGTSTTGSKLLKTINNVKALDAGESYINSCEVTIDERIYGKYNILVTSDMYNVTDIDWATDAPVYPYNPQETGYLTAKSATSYSKLSEVTVNDKKDNFFYTQIDIAIPPLPDLQIPKIQILSNGNPVNETFGGSSVDVIVTIQNKGEAAVINKRVSNILYCSHADYYENDQLTTLQTSSKTLNLLPGESCEEQFTVTLPTRYHGDLFFHAYTDRYDEVYELANKENNWGTSERLNVIVAPGADLQPVSISVKPSVVTANQTITVSYAVENMGAGEPDVRKWHDKIYLCKNPNDLNAAKQILASVPVTYTEDHYIKDLNIRMGDYTGAYYIGVMTDADDAVFEYGGEDNNTLYTTNTVTFVNPDLTIELNKIYSDTIKSGDDVSFEWKIKNIGTGNLENAMVNCAFYASSSTSGANARYLGSIDQELWIPSGSEKLLRGTFTVPYGTRLDALQYVFVKINADHSITEESVDNNVSNMISRWCKLIPKSASSSSNKSDLVVSNITLPDTVMTSTYFTVDWTCANQGGKDAGSFVAAIYLSDDEVWNTNDIIVSSKRVSSLAQGTTVDIHSTVYIPDEYRTKKYLIFVADSRHVIDETDEKNNYIAKPVELIQGVPSVKLPDLALTFVKIPSTVRSLEYFTVNWSCSNIGESNAGAFINGIYLSDDELWSEDDLLLATQRTPSLKSNEKVDNQTALYIPDEYVGQKYLIFRADIHNVMEEGTKANNDKAIGVNIEKGTRPEPEEPDPSHSPDLTVTQVAVSDGGITTMSDFTLNWTCVNMGTADATPFTAGIYLSNDETLDDDDLLLGTQYVAMLKKGISINYQSVLNIPDAYSGNLYLIVCADINNTVNEIKETNNIKVLSVEVNRRPGISIADLCVEIISIPEVVNATSDFTAKWNVKNEGMADAGTFINAIYISNDAALSSDDQIISNEVISSLSAKSETECEFVLNIPQEYTGKKYLIFCTDIYNTVVEKNKSNNFIVKPLLVRNASNENDYADLAIKSLQIPDELTTSKEFTAKWSVNNIGKVDASTFISAVYLSDNDIYDDEDVLLSSERTSSLKIGSTVEYQTSLSIADKYNGNKYLIFYTNAYGSVDEAETSNNMTIVPVSIACSPLPDLKVETFESGTEFTEGQEISLVTKVTNSGEVETRQTRWVTEYYLSSTATFNKDNAVKLGYSSHNGMLKPDESYVDSVTVSLPQDISGNFLIFAYVDATDAIYESNESNNISRGKVIQIYHVEERPVDLCVEKLVTPLSVTAGENITLTYKITNTGEYAATGVLRDVIYLSKDDKWDYDDIQVGIVTGHVNIAAGQDIIREVTGRIVNVPEGKYYFIVKTNSTRSIPEVSEDDNMAVSYMASQVIFQTLQLGSAQQVNTCGYYKIDVNSMPNSQTVSFTLAHPEEASVGLYVGYETVPSTANYNYASFALSEEQQNVILPVANSGRYYILAQDNSSLINSDGYVFSLNGGSDWAETDMTLTAETISFGATSLSVNEGGTDGWISTNIKGALFDSIMDFRLAAETRIIPAEKVIFRDQTSSDVTFNLHNAEVGMYDVVTELPNGVRATLPNGFHVIPGVQCDLGIKIDAPRVVHSGSHSPVSISLANGGTNDIQIKEIIIKMRGAYLGKSVSEFKSESTELHLVPDGYEADRFGYISIPPGKQEVINFFMEQHSATSYMSVYLVK